MAQIPDDKFSGSDFIGLDSDGVGEGQDGSTQPNDTHLVKMLHNNQDNIWQDGWRQSWTPYHRSGAELDRYWSTRNKGMVGHMILPWTTALESLALQMEVKVNDSQATGVKGIQFGLEVYSLRERLSAGSQDLIASDTIKVNDTTGYEERRLNIGPGDLRNSDKELSDYTSENVIVSLAMKCDVARPEYVTDNSVDYFTDSGDAFLDPNQKTYSADDCVNRQDDLANAHFFDLIGAVPVNGAAPSIVYMRDRENVPQDLGGNIDLHKLKRAYFRNLSIETQYRGDGGTYQSISNTELEAERPVQSSVDRKLYQNADATNTRQRCIRWGQVGRFQGDPNTWSGRESHWPEVYGDGSTAQTTTLQKNAPLNVNITNGKVHAHALYIPSLYLKRQSSDPSKDPPVPTSLAPWEWTFSLRQYKNGSPTPSNIAQAVQTMEGRKREQHFGTAYDSKVSPFLLTKVASAEGTGFDFQQSFGPKKGYFVYKDGILYEDDLPFLRSVQFEVDVSPDGIFSPEEPTVFNLKTERKTSGTINWGEGVPSNFQTSDHLSITLVGLSIFEQGYGQGV